MLRGAYGDIVEDAAPVAPGSGVSRLVEDDDDLKLGRYSTLEGCRRARYSPAPLYGYSEPMYRVEYSCFL